MEILSSENVCSSMIFEKKSSFIFNSGNKRYLTVMNEDNQITTDEKSIVVRCYDRIDKKRTILKIINNNCENSGDEFIPLKMDHPNIIKYDYVEHNPTISFIYMKKYESDLIDYFCRDIEENEIDRIFKKMCNSVEYLHKNRIAHFDIKLENFLIDDAGEIVLSDFGFATEWEDSEPEVSIFKGSWYYVSPEIMYKKLYPITKPDIWALGVCLYAMLNDRFPFIEDEPRVSLREKITQYPVNISPKHIFLIENILIENMDERPNIMKIQEWLK